MPDPLGQLKLQLFCRICNISIVYSFFNSIVKKLLNQGTFLGRNEMYYNSILFNQFSNQYILFL